MDGKPKYDKLYPGHIPTTPFQRGLLALGSAVMCLYNPARDGTSPFCIQILLVKILTFFYINSSPARKIFGKSWINSSPTRDSTDYSYTKYNPTKDSIDCSCTNSNCTEDNIDYSFSMYQAQSR